MKKLLSMLSYPKLPVITVFLAVGLTLPALWNGFCFDDYLHRLILLGDNPVSREMPATSWNLFCFHRGDDVVTERLVYEGAPLFDACTKPSLHMCVDALVFVPTRNGYNLGSSSALVFLWIGVHGFLAGWLANRNALLTLPLLGLCLLHTTVSIKRP